MGHLCHVPYDQLLQVPKQVDQTGQQVDRGTALVVIIIIITIITIIITIFIIIIMPRPAGQEKKYC